MCDSHHDSERKYKYYPEDFGDLTVDVLHMDLIFDVFDEYTVVDSVLHVRVKEEIESLDLNAKGLEILSVKVEGVDVEYKVYTEDDLLEVLLDREYDEGEKLRIYTRTICRPTENVLEGLYYDVTPSNCPKTQITQCQQWGFQRIVPCIDDMTAKCTYKTTIIADSRYTNLLSNGDVIQSITEVGDGRVKIVYDNSVTPMATYLFFLGVGTYETFEKRFVYPDGKDFSLELLVPPGSDKDRAEVALEVLSDAIMWVYLFTGADKYKNWKKSLKLWDLYKERDGAVDDKTWKEFQAKLKVESEGIHFGYRYTGTVYREIGMQNSDFGGMENVGNTTIVTNRIMPFEDMTDGGFQYMISVKVHEYYHNLNGSEVTGKTPFEIWLNEAVTVFIEQDYARFLWGEDYCRLEEYIGVVAPDVGVMARDKSSIAMPIEPDGFNDTNELITGVTYVKAPEFVRMIETLIGKEKFVKGLDRYHTRFKHGNATRADWVKAMEEVSGLDLSGMAASWLKKLRYPELKIVKEYQGNVLSLNIKQTNCGEIPWEFPLKVAVYSDSGEKSKEMVVWIRDKEVDVEIDDLDSVEFVSINPGFSAFVDYDMEISEEELYKKVYLDDDVVGRFMAWESIQEKVKIDLLRGNMEEIPESFLELMMELIQYSVSDYSIGAMPWVLFKGVKEFGFADRYKDLFELNRRIKREFADRYFDELIDMWKSIETVGFAGYLNEIEEIKKREIKNSIMSLLVEVSDEAKRDQVWEMVKTQFEKGEAASDRIAALRMMARSGGEKEVEFMLSQDEWASENLVRLESYLGVISGISESGLLIDTIKKIMKKEWFDINQSSHQRALLVGFVGNRKVSFETEEGLDFLQDVIVKLAKVNEYSAFRVLGTIGQVNGMRESIQKDMKDVLDEVLVRLKDVECDGVKNNIKNILGRLDV
jgi:aminopeptidase N